MDEQLPLIETHFIKCDDFRTVYGSGVYGGFTPAGKLNMYVYTERIPVPKRIDLKVDIESQSVVGEAGREGKSGLVREVQFGVLFDVDTARSMVDWLKRHIAQYDEAVKAANQ